ncbi:MAG: tetratricopeptide repeat protein, partial [Microvirga sp.]
MRLSWIIGGALLAASATSSHAAGPDLAYGAYQRGLYQTAFREANLRLEKNTNDAAAMTLLGELYNQGLGVAMDPKKASEWYRLAAGRGDANALASLGLMALDGRGMPKDPKAGRRWLEQATAQGSSTAAYNLGLILIGTGATADE